ncbi:MAG: CPBP family glutamic-type intramembrane protease [Thermoplasmata archaeon]
MVDGFAAPVVEEPYFRGNLLPRVSHLGRTAPFVSAVLFYAYHFWMPLSGGTV